LGFAGRLRPAILPLHEGKPGHPFLRTGIAALTLRAALVAGLRTSVAAMLRRAAVIAMLRRAAVLVGGTLIFALILTLTLRLGVALIASRVASWFVS
jgi:hypothetical protein